MIFFQKLKAFFNIGRQLQYYNNKLLSDLAYQIRSDNMKEKTLSCKKMGVCTLQMCDKEVIVSLTSYGNRIYDVYLSIESIMQGTVKPNRIILWLSDKLKNEDLPKTLQMQIARGLEVEYCKDIRSYTKLIPALRKYPDSIIITIDDDVIYELDIVEKLVKAYQKNPHYIHANRIHRITLDCKGEINSYNNWKWCYNGYDMSSLNFLTGVGGVLYPPKSLDDAVFDEDVFLDICKTADDVWFYLMALKKGTHVKKVYTHSPKGEDYILNNSPSEMGLLVKNTDSVFCQNDVQFKAVMQHYRLSIKETE